MENSTFSCYVISCAMYVLVEKSFVISEMGKVDFEIGIFSEDTLPPFGVIEIEYTIFSCITRDYTFFLFKIFVNPDIFTKCTDDLPSTVRYYWNLKFLTYFVNRLQTIITRGVSSCWIEFDTKKQYSFLPIKSLQK